MLTDQLKTRYLELLALAAASIAIWWRPIARTASLAVSSGEHTHILLVLPLSTALIYFASRRIRVELTNSPVGLILLGAALLLRILGAWATASDNLSLSMLGLVVWWFGSVIVCLGFGWFRALLFPLGLLLLLIPFPDGLLTAITEFLQHGSAWATAILFRIAAVPVTRDGIVVSIPGLDIEVARECSSIRSSMMLLLVTLILAHLFLRSWWTKALLALAVVPLSIAKNAVRIFTIVELATRVDPSFLDGRLHHHGGFLFLGLAVFAVIWLMWLLRRGEARRVPHRSLIA